MIWIIGEYAERIDNADELLEQFLETFPEETSLVSHCPEIRTVAVQVYGQQHSVSCSLAILLNLVCAEVPSNLVSPLCCV